MPLKNTDQSLMDNYLLGQLSAAEQVQFETRMKDIDFKVELAFQTDAMAAITAFNRAQSKAQTASWEAELQQAKIRPLRSEKGMQWLAAALVVFAVAWIVIWLFHSLQLTSTQQLYANYYERFPNIIAPIEKGNSPPADSATAGVQAYELGEYKRAIELLDQQNADASRLYIGLSYLELGNVDAAIEHLKASKPADEYAQIRAWYLGLAWLQKGKILEARAAFENARSGSGSEILKKKATELLQQLD